MRRLATLAIVACLPSVCLADEGMWTFDNPPRAAIKERYGVDLTDAWLKRVSTATVRLEGGCTGSFVSPKGLILTNQHCAKKCVSDNSTAERNLLADGFLASRPDEELVCPGTAVSFLVDTEDVTTQVQAATHALDPVAAVKARRAELTRLEQACEEASQAAAGGPLKCEAVTLYGGGQYWLYRYRRYEDVRLVFAPEDAVANFGGDVDNFQFPRWSLDTAFLRAYDNGEPASPPVHLSFDWTGAVAGEPVFVSGHPGGTSRLLTTLELDARRDVSLPFWLLWAAEQRGRMIQFAKTGAEAARIVERPLWGLENSIKVQRKRLDALQDDAMMARRAAEEEQTRAFLASDPAFAADAQAYAEIELAQRVYRDIYLRHTLFESGYAFSSSLFQQARRLVRAASERALPNDQRMRAYTDARLPAVRRALAAATPVYPELEKLQLSFSLDRAREWLGPDDPVLKRVLGNDSPEAVAIRLVEGSRLADPKLRMAIYEGGQAAIEASDDPMILLARLVEPESRALYERMENEVEGPVQNAHEKIAAARFRLFGTSIYPDATFTLRLTYGAVAGWVEQGKPVEPFTQVGRTFERATGQAPFQLPETWLSKQGSIDGSTPYDFSSTLDIIGGNSGSPVVDARGDIVGLAFDGNIHSISGDYWYDPVMNRTVSVDVRAIRLALDRIYGARALLEEIDAGR